MALDIRSRLILAACVPADAREALLVGRVWLPAADGPTVVRIDGDDLLDLSGLAPTTSELFDQPHVARAIRNAQRLPRVGSLQQVLGNSHRDGDPQSPRLLAPCDLQAIKAAGVTFVASMLERVIEEQARGDPARAEAVRRRIAGVVGANLRSVRPGSDEAARVKDVLMSLELIRNAARA